jgi:hypothetical protein
MWSILYETPTDVPGLTTTSLGLEANTVLNGFFSVIGSNIVPILTLMGIMLGVTWVIRKFGAAKKSRI